MTTLYSSPAAKKAIQDLYFDKLDELGIDYESSRIETSFGDTHLLITGNESGPPLVLLHGANGTAPVAIEALIGLREKFKIYAIDLIGQPNLSAETRPSMHSEAYGQWLQEILSRLHVTEVTLVGISFGGFVSWKTLVFDERRISSTFLIVPAGIVNGNPLQALWRVFLPMRLYMKTRHPKYVHRFLQALFTREDTFAVRFLSKVFLHFKMDFSPIPTLSKTWAARVHTPVYVAGAGNDLMFPGKKLLKRAAKIFPNFGGKLLLEQSRHVPGEQDNQRLVEWITEHALNNRSLNV